jgi:hypothetical protein
MSNRRTRSQSQLSSSSTNGAGLRPNKRTCRRNDDDGDATPPSQPAAVRSQLAPPEPDPANTNCSICLDRVTIQGKMDSCAHLFCFDCVRQWAEKENTCPLCKQRFHFLQKVDVRVRSCRGCFSSIFFCRSAHLCDLRNASRRYFFVVVCRCCLVVVAVESQWRRCRGQTNARLAA